MRRPLDTIFEPGDQKMPPRRRQILLLAIPLVAYVAWIHWWASLDFPLEGEICGAPQNSCSNYNIVIYSLWLLANALDHWSAVITAIAAASIALLVWTFQRSSEQMWTRRTGSPPLLKEHWLNCRIHSSEYKSSGPGLNFICASLSAIKHTRRSWRMAS